jgi:hypothetical protein
VTKLFDPKSNFSNRDGKVQEWQKLLFDMVKEKQSYSESKRVSKDKKKEKKRIQLTYEGSELRRQGIPLNDDGITPRASMPVQEKSGFHLFRTLTSDSPSLKPPLHGYYSPAESTPRTDLRNSSRSTSSSEGAFVSFMNDYKRATTAVPPSPAPAPTYVPAPLPPPPPAVSSEKLKTMQDTLTFMKEQISSSDDAEEKEMLKEARKALWTTYIAATTKL